MKRLAYIFPILLVLSSTSSTLFSQNDPLAGQDSIVLENDRIEDVIDSNKPFVKPPYQKIEEADRSDFRFDSKDFYVETDFEPAPPKIKPWPKERAEALRNNVLSLGVGRYLTPYAQLNLHNGPAGNVDLGLDFTHLSAHQDEIPLRKFREDYGTVSLRSIQRDYTLGASAYVYNTTYFTYADTALLNDEVAREDSLRRGYTRAKVGATFETNFNPDAQFEADAGIDYRFIAGNGGNRENNLDLTPNAAYMITREFKVGFDGGLTLSTGQLDTVDQSRFYLDALPYVAFDNGTVRIKGGVRYNTFRNSLDSASVSNFGGIVELSAGIIPDQFAFLAGYRTGMKNNTYYDLLHENQYLQQSAVYISPTIEKLHVYLGGKGNIGGTVDYSARVFYKRMENQLMFFTEEFGSEFDLIYDSLMTVTGTQIEVNFSPEDFLDVGGTFNLNIYNTNEQVKYFHATPVRLDLYGIYRWDEKLTARADLNVFGPRTMSIDSNDELIKQGAFVGLNLSGDYRVTEGFSVFLNVNNLLANKYQRWHNYPERRIDFMGGVRIAF